MHPFVPPVAARRLRHGLQHQGRPRRQMHPHEGGAGGEIGSGVHAPAEASRMFAQSAAWNARATRHTAGMGFFRVDRGLHDHATHIRT